MALLLKILHFTNFIGRQWKGIYWVVE